MKTKEKVEQGKGTADHLMPLGYLLKIILFSILSLRKLKLSRWRFNEQRDPGLGGIYGLR